MTRAFFHSPLAKTEFGARRPIRLRNIGPMPQLVAALARTRLKPNDISVFGVFAAALCGLALYDGAGAEGLDRTLLLLTGALACLIRCFCNLADGMMAVEHGRATPNGRFWNEVPDRVSDTLILIGLGYGVDGPALGWAASTFAIATPYLREFGDGADFRGPFAKPQRMAVVCLRAVFAAIPWSGDQGNAILIVSLWIITIGTAVTALRRAVRLA